MKIGTQLTVIVLTAHGTLSGALASVSRRLRAENTDDPERGDVPGWVMITLMSAVLVAGLLAIAGPALETMFTEAMSKVGK